MSLTTPWNVPPSERMSAVSSAAFAVLPFATASDSFSSVVSSFFSFLTSTSLETNLIKSEPSLSPSIAALAAANASGSIFSSAIIALGFMIT